MRIQHVTLRSFTGDSLYWEAAIRLEKSKHLTVTSRESALWTPCHHTQSQTPWNYYWWCLVLAVNGRTSVAFRYSPRSICGVLRWRNETVGASRLYFFAWTTPAEKGRSQTLTFVQLPEVGMTLKKRQTHSHAMSKKTPDVTILVQLTTWEACSKSVMAVKVPWFLEKKSSLCDVTD